MRWIAKHQWFCLLYNIYFKKHPPYTFAANVFTQKLVDNFGCALPFTKVKSEFIHYLEYKELYRCLYEYPSSQSLQVHEK